MAILRFVKINPFVQLVMTCRRSVPDFM